MNNFLNYSQIFHLMLIFLYYIKVFLIFFKSIKFNKISYLINFNKIKKWKKQKLIAKIEKKIYLKINNLKFKLKKVRFKENTLII